MTRRLIWLTPILLVCLWTAPFAQEPPTVEVPGTIPVPATDARPTQVAVPVKEVPSPAAPSNPQEAVGWGLGAALIVDYLKKKKWFTFLTETSTARAKSIFGFVAAFLTAAGIQFTVSGSVLDAGGAAVTLTNITLVGIKDVLFQWIVQEGWYRGLIQRTTSAAVGVAR